MKMQSLSATWAIEEFGGRRAPDGTLARDNFKDWFAHSITVDSQGRPLTLHHGTGSSQQILQNGFSYDYTAVGVDQLGPGWYFTDRLETAVGYKSRRLQKGLPKIGGEESPGVVDVYLRLQHPLHTKEGQLWFDQLPELNPTSVRKMILAAPSINDPDGPISNWGDLGSTSLTTIVDKIVKSYSNRPSHFTLFNDFYEGDTRSFVIALRDVTGHDGLIHEFKTGERHYVAWFPEAIKSASLNNGLFDSQCCDITDHSSNKAILARAESALGVINQAKSTNGAFP